MYCKDCKFYQENKGECHRYPPSIWSETHCEFSTSYCCNFPEVKGNDWCGEFKPIEKDNDQISSS